jgi:hypothetical protein
VFSDCALCVIQSLLFDKTLRLFLPVVTSDLRQKTVPDEVPPMAVQLTDRDRDCVGTLVHAVRVFSDQQIIRHWFGGDKNNARAASARIRQLEASGLLGRLKTMAHPELDLQAPLLDWRPGQAEPDIAALARRIHHRWSKPPCVTHLVYATELANRRFGGFVGARPPRTSETTHDLHLAAVYLQYRIQRPSAAKKWVAEAQLYSEGWGRHSRLPDALIRRGNGRDVIVEFGGRYSYAKLCDFHRCFCHQRYEIW